MDKGDLLQSKRTPHRDVFPIQKCLATTLILNDHFPLRLTRPETDAQVKKPVPKRPSQAAAQSRTEGNLLAGYWPRSCRADRYEGMMDYVRFIKRSLAPTAIQDH